MKKLTFILILFMACTVFGQKPVTPKKIGAPKAAKENALMETSSKKAGPADFLALVRVVNSTLVN